MLQAKVFANLNSNGFDDDATMILDVGNLTIVASVTYEHSRGYRGIVDVSDDIWLKYRGKDGKATPKQVEKLHALIMGRCEFDLR